MKKLLILLVVLSTGFFSCKKDKAQPAVDAEILSIENATLIVSGNLAFSSETNSGMVKVYQQKNGKYLLALEDLVFKVSRPSFVIYLSQSEIVSTSSIKIFSVGKLSRNILHALPPNIDFTVFKYVVIQTNLRTKSLSALNSTNTNSPIIHSYCEYTPPPPSTLDTEDKLPCKSL